MSFLKLQDVDLYYELHGEGPPVVFIHGASGTHLSWWQQIAQLRHHFSCLIYDQRGYGRSRPTAPYNVGEGRHLYEDLRSLIEHVGLSGGKLSIVGASLGTAPALHYAMEHRDQIDKLVLVCGVGGSHDAIDRRWLGTALFTHDGATEGASGRAAAIGRHKPAGRVPPIRSAGEFERFAVAYHPYGPVGQTMHMDSPAQTFLYAEIMAMAGGPPTVETLPCFKSRPVSAQEASTVQFPVLVVGGTEDPLFPPPELEQVGTLFPQGRTNLFKGAGHAAYYERPNRFNDLMLDFLRYGHET